MENVIDINSRGKEEDVTSMVDTVMEKIQAPSSLTIIFNYMSQETKIKEDFVFKLKKIMDSFQLNVSEERESIILRILVEITQTSTFVKKAMEATYGTNNKGMANFDKQLKKSPLTRRLAHIHIEEITEGE